MIWGRVLGLDRAPEVTTVRRNLTRLAAFGRAAEFGRALAERRVALRGAAMGFLYVDGHARGVIVSNCDLEPNITLPS